MNDTASMTGLLSFPASDPSSSAEILGHTSPIPSSSRQLLRDRLFIGNLHPTVDEYTLLQIFTKFGKVTKLDFLFHKSGALKGKPRGYAFLEYGSHNEAQRALNSVNGKLLHGRKLAVTYANQAPDIDGGGISRQRKTMMETGRPTTLSMLKSSAGSKHKHGSAGFPCYVAYDFLIMLRMSNKIAMMEAKLRELEASKPRNDSELGTSTLLTSSLPTHPSLPLKPPPSIPNISVPQLQRPTASKQHPAGSFVPLSRPSISFTSSDHYTHPGSEPSAKKIKFAPTSGCPEVVKRKSSGKVMLGVKIVKKRTSPSPATSAGSDECTVHHHHNHSAISVDAHTA
ncbi:hypothetical protein J3R30DRAFT_677396 [Lentinula aciculospora]|uniref:Probable RNA-binding protein 18 n=1 Tax=Lentinula aciculospora TaxID=153920 RepID=A0A9W9A5K4_9AGAR|nr:hypothetical protein J3R30DRAFT_677396 [Lentinula aciculospora]